MKIWISIPKSAWENLQEAEAQWTDRVLLSKTPITDDAGGGRQIVMAEVDD